MLENVDAGICTLSMDRVILFYIDGEPQPARSVPQATPLLHTGAEINVLLIPCIVFRRLVFVTAFCLYIFLCRSVDVYFSEENVNEAAPVGDKVNF